VGDDNGTDADGSDDDSTVTPPARTATN
jgi:hypothetical protein